MNEDSKVSLGEHLIEFKKRFLLSLLVLAISWFISYLYSENIFSFLLHPLSKVIGNSSNHKMIYTNLTEAFFTYLKLSFFVGFIFSFPFIAVQFYLFIAPGLYKNEKKTILPFLIVSPILFIAGAALVYYFVFPLAWKFFLGFENRESVDSLPIILEAKISEYLSLVIQLVIAFGMAFQLPVILVFLVKVNVIDIDWLVSKRKLVVVAIFIIAAILTPPDVISQIGLAIPLLLLYELAILFCKCTNKNNRV